MSYRACPGSGASHRPRWSLPNRGRRARSTSLGVSQRTHTGSGLSGRICQKSVTKGAAALGDRVTFWSHIRSTVAGSESEGADATESYPRPPSARCWNPKNACVLDERKQFREVSGTRGADLVSRERHGDPAGGTVVAKGLRPQDRQEKLLLPPPALGMATEFTKASWANGTQEKEVTASSPHETSASFPRGGRIWPLEIWGLHLRGP